MLVGWKLFRRFCLNKIVCYISLKYNQQDATFSRSIYFYKLLYMFQAAPPPIIRSTKLYIQRQVLSTNTAVSCYHISPPQPNINLCAKCPAHLILLKLTTRIILGEKHKSWSSSLWTVLQYPDTFTFLGPNTFLSALLWTSSASVLP